MSAVLVFDGCVLPDVDEGSTGPLVWEVPEGGVHALLLPAPLVAPLVRACIGMAEPVAGTVRVLGIDPARLPRRSLLRLRRRMGVWVTPPALLSNATLRLNVLMPLLHDGRWNRRSAAARADEILDRCGAAPWADLRPAAAPAPARCRTALARALVRRPELLIAEDLADDFPAAELPEIIALCRAEARTTVIATAAADLAARADSALELDCGLPAGGAHGT
jgi:ABC-type transporter Mla maintaining outer membrane lipid asymmetry ATPase subunit MlaF